MGTFSAWSLFLVASLLAVKVLSQDEFDLADALEDVTKAPAVTTKPKPKPIPFEDEDIGLDFDDVPTKAPPKTPPKVTKAPPKTPIKPKTKPDDTQAEFDFGATLRPGLLPRATKSPRIPNIPQPASDELDLSDALDPNNDIGVKDKNKGQDKGVGGGNRGNGTPDNRGGNRDFSDSDLEDVGNDDTYKPDKGKGGRGGSHSADENNYDTDTMAETGTIAGIISAVGVALVGAITSYVSYQKKKFCFSIQQSLQGDLVKADNPDAVVATEPQVQQTLLEPPNAEPPSEENAV